MHRIKTTGALYLDLGREAAHQPDVLNHISTAAIFADQFCAPRRLQRRCLSLIFQQINYARRKGLVKFQVSELKILYFYEHNGRSEIQWLWFVGGTLGRSATDA
jgi:hypothetical protein